MIVDQGAMGLLAFEIKFTKTPKKKMASNLGQFRKNFPKLNVINSNVVTLNDDDIQLTKGVSSLGINSYLNQLI